LVAKVAIGVDLGGTNVRLGAVSEKGDIISSSRMFTDVGKGPASVIGRIVTAVKSLMRKSSGPGRGVLGVGIGVPGIISLPEGIVRFSPNLPGWNDIQLRDKMEKALGLPVVVENDANAYALGEHRFGAGIGTGSMLCITLGTGVGGGIIIDGLLVRGSDGMAGEVGHMTVRPNGILCNCGNRGCLERYASATAIVERTVSAMRRGATSSLVPKYSRRPELLTALTVYDAAMAGDALSARIYRDAGRSLGIVSAGLINLLNMDRIVVGGGMAGAWEIISGPMRAEATKRAFDIPAARCGIVQGLLGDDAGVLGAAGLVFYGKGGKKGE
jgi:glucokinase